MTLVEEHASPQLHWSWRTPHARAVFTTRPWGNLAAHVGDAPERVMACRNEVARELLPNPYVATVTQVHEDHIQRVVAGVSDWREREVVGEADAIVTGLMDAPIAVFTADCLPIAIANDTEVAVVHAGWRGLLKGVIEQALDSMSHYGQLRAVVGPCIGRCCFEVGEDVAVHFPHHVAIVNSAGARTRLVDLAQVATDRLRARDCSVDVIDVCTVCDERLHSFRRDGDRAGRQAVIAWRA